MGRHPVDTALLALRKTLIRQSGKGLEQVEAMLRERGALLPPQPPPRRTYVRRRGHMQRNLLEALHDRPGTLRELAAHVAERNPDLAPEVAYRRTAKALHRMKTAGLVVHDRPVWRLPRGGS